MNCREPDVFRTRVRWTKDGFASDRDLASSTRRQRGNVPRRNRASCWPARVGSLVDPSFVFCFARPRVMSVAVIIPTYGRDERLLSVLGRVSELRPRPDEVIVHIDNSDGTLEKVLINEFPQVKLLSSHERIGPGGGRHRCLLACASDYAVSFDDNSYPVDEDFVDKVCKLFGALPDAAVLAASIWHPEEPEIPRGAGLVSAPNFVGCGHAIRLKSYRALRGYLARPLAYGLEESDLALQLFAAGWKIFHSAELRVFHDTDRRRHNTPEITSAQITNLG